MLGMREPDVYGHQTLDDVEALCEARAKKNRLSVDFRQSNHEGELVDWIQQARGVCAGIILNPGGYTHTSIAIMDALQAVALPTIEVHISNIHQREPFRHRSYVSLVARGSICGFGVQGYALAIDGLHALLEGK
jgi:3-dehydroquinate dehydratase-2